MTACGSATRRFIPAHAGNTTAAIWMTVGYAVHPRARGEYAVRARGGVPQRGSSPRTRGIRPQSRKRGGPVRFIPAHAGNTDPAASFRGASPVHPRARGEYSGIRSSNRVRFRFIPAHAGNTASPAATPETSAVHPRARGEYSHHARLKPSSDGSSPRTRGIHESPFEGASMGRFIPAHAGNTLLYALNNASWSVHPRARGEYVAVSVFPRSPSGSSPRTRGIHQVNDQVGVGPRFIPAHAGNTPALRLARRVWPVHPRARGEYQYAHSHVYREPGSSPRTRGIRSARRTEPAARRFIPAHAGNTWRKAHSPAPRTVHPRARGEYSVNGTRRPMVFGSSPRTRGIRSRS